MELEKLGKPTVTLVTDMFRGVGETQTKGLGMPTLPRVILPHPIGGERAEVVREKAEKAFEQVVSALTVEPRLAAAQTAKEALAASTIVVEDSVEAINDLFLTRGMTDGHFINPPTPTKVEAMLKGVNRRPQEEIAILAPGYGVATVEKIAINAVMAWCRPEYMPVLIAAVEAIAQPQFSLYTIQCTTHPSGTPMLILNGPIRSELGINCSSGCFGHGTRANSTMGRAIRLILTNIGGGYPGQTDMSTHGWPGKHGFCYGENEEQSPWEPLHVERGFPASASTVTVVGTGGTYNFGDLWSTTGDSVLSTAARAMSTLSRNLNSGGEPYLILSPEHAGIAGRDGLSKVDAKRFIFERMGALFSGLPPAVKDSVVKIEASRNRFPNLSDDTIIKPANNPSDMVIVVAGGPGPQSVFIPTYGAGTRSVTRKIE